MRLERLLARLGLTADSQAVRLFLGYLKPYRGSLLLASFLLLVASCLQLATPLLTGYIIDKILAAKKAEVLHLIIPMLLLLTAAYLISNLVRSYMLTKMKFRLSLKLHQHQLRKVSRLSFTFTSKKETGYLAARILDDAEWAREFATGDLVSLLQKLFTLMAALAAMAWLSWQTALVSLLVIPFYLILGSAYVAPLRKLSRECMESRAQRERSLHEILSGMYSINACGAEPYMLQRFLGSQVRVVRAQMAQFWLGAKVSLARSLVAAAGPLVVLWYGGLQVIEGRISIGDLVAFSAIFGYLFNAAQSLSAMHLSVQKVAVSLERLCEILSQTPLIRQPAKPVKLSRIESPITFRDVTFSYDGGRQALSRLNLEIPAGKVTAVVGKSGAGKTTLAHLLMRFYDPQVGAVQIDAKDIRTLSLRSLRRKVSLVPQDVFLFSMSVEDNIRLGDPSADRSRVEQAARLANAHEFILQLPQGYQTPVGERGISLSGGQRQRIALARALLIDPLVLILDEAVSSVDPASEELICETVRRLNAEKSITVVVIAHRLSTIQQSDFICLLQDGRLAAQGSHAFLLRSSPAYAELIRFQQSEATKRIGPALAQAG